MENIPSDKFINNQHSNVAGPYRSTTVQHTLVINLVRKFICLISIVSISGCKKFIQIEPPTNQLVTSTVFKTDATAIASILGIYGRMMQSNGYAGGNPGGSIYSYSGLSADEFISYSSTLDPFYTNSLDANNASVSSDLWAEPYRYIYTVNSILEGIEKSSEISQAVIKQLEGEAKFIRAFCYFYLVNQFGDVPLQVTTNYKETNTALRASKQVIYKQIILDLTDAKNLLREEYIKPDNSAYQIASAERVRPNKYAAIAMLARVYLFTGNWANAENESTLVINNNNYYSLVSNLNAVFLKNSKEAIWQLMPVWAGFNTNEGRFLILTAAPTTVSIAPQLISAFENGDQRSVNWIKSFFSGNNTYYYPYKYQVRVSSNLTEYSMVLRLAEQYLIRAEARAQQGNLAGALNDLNNIRNRAFNNVGNYSGATDKESVLNAILHERQVELFSEYGHRWLDLKRTNRADDVLSVVKGINWQNTDTLYPIPQSEILNNPKITQNLGY